MPERERQTFGEDYINPRGWAQERYGADPGIPPEKLAVEVGTEADRQLRNITDFQTALEKTQRVWEKVQKIQDLQAKKGVEYEKSLKEVLKLKDEELQKELAQYDLNLKRYKLSTAQQQEQLAQARVMKREGVDPQDIPGYIRGASPADVMRGAAPLRPDAYPASVLGRPGESGRLATWARGSYLGRQMSEAREAGRGVSLTNPASLMGLARANPLISAALVGGYTLRGFGEGRGVHIPGVGPVPFSDWQTQLAAGQVTGEGHGAGLAARGEAVRMGINPLDQISMQVANSIVTAVRGQGFRGAMAREFENSIKDIYKDTGLPVEQVAQLGEIFARGGRLDEFRGMMQDLDEVAKNANLSITAVAGSFEELQKALVGQGGLANTNLPSAYTYALSKLGLTSQQLPGATSFMTTGATQYTGLQGAAALSSFGQKQFQQSLRQMLPAWRSSIEGLPREQQDLLIGQMVAGGVFPGISDIPTARKLIMGGPQFLRDLETGKKRALTQSKVEGIFGGASRAQDEAAESPWSFDLKVDSGRSAYIKQFIQGARKSGVAQSEIDKITRDLEKNKGDSGLWGGTDWGASVGRARSRMEDLIQKRVDKGQTINLKLDAGETRRLLSGKGISKTVQVEDAFKGVVSTIGSAFGLGD